MQAAERTRNMTDINVSHKFRRKNGEEFFLPALICPTPESAIDMAEKIDKDAVYVGIRIKY